MSAFSVFRQGLGTLCGAQRILGPVLRPRDRFPIEFEARAPILLGIDGF